jgi:hypothetical protein
MDRALHSDVKHGPLEMIEAGRLADECGEPWYRRETEVGTTRYGLAGAGGPFGAGPAPPGHDAACCCAGP